MNDNKIIEFSTAQKNYLRLANKKAEQGDAVASLGFLLSALKNEYSVSILSSIANTYSDMGLVSLSNLYWFKYLSICDENSKSIAYEQLAINFFYMDNLFASSYYFHLKLSKDGYVSKDSIDEEILEFLQQSFDKKNAYHLAYPYAKADWSITEKMAKQALASGDYASAEKIYSKIPKECMNEDVSGEYAICLFLNKKDKQMIEVCKNSLQLNGENVTAYCNLSSLYHSKKYKEKSKYYYNKALEVYKNTLNQAYKLATCAMEQSDHKTANDCLKKITEDRTYDITMNYFYGISQVNVGDYEGAYNTFNEIYRIYPQDKIVEFYVNYASELEKTGNDHLNILPLTYQKNLPISIVKKYKKKISELFADPKKALSQIKKVPVQKILEWGLIQEDVEYSKNVVFILINSDTLWAENLLKNSLMDIDVNGETKRTIISMLVLKGCKEKLDIIANDFLVSFKPKKIVCENKIDGDLFVASYAITLSKMAFWNIDCFDKLAFATNKIYKKLSTKIYFEEVLTDDMCALIVCVANVDKLKDVEYVCKIFNANYKTVKKYLGMIKGEKQ